MPIFYKYDVVCNKIVDFNRGLYFFECYFCAKIVFGFDRKKDAGETFKRDC